MKRTFGALALVLLLAAVAYYGTLWYGARSAVAKLEDAVSPWGDLRWDSVRPSWDGSVTLKGVRWHWFDITKPVLARRITLEAPGLLSLPTWFLGDEQPRQWRLRVDNAELTVEPDLFRPWARSRRALSLKRHPLHFHGCGEQAALTPADLLRMGVDRITADISLKDRGPGSSGPQYRASVEAGRLGSLSFAWNAETFQLPVLSEGAATPAMPGEGRLLVRDAGLMRRLSSFCAAAEDEPVREWVDRTADHWASSMVDEGLVPTDATTALYREWLREGGELLLAWSLDDASAITETGVSATQWRQRAGLRVTYNGRERDGIGFSLNEPSEPPTETVSAPLVPVEKDPSPQPAFRESDTERAGAWIDRRVRLELASGREVEGRLVAREGDALHVQRTLEGGSVVAPFQRADIERFEVWRRVDDMGRPISDGDEGPGLEDFLNPDLGRMPRIPPPSAPRED